MQLNTQNFVTLLENMAAAVQSSAAALIDLTVGSVVRAILEANASVALWLQWLILQVLTMTRLATSAGSDVDTWVGDFGLTRLPAVASSGPVTFGRYSISQAGYVPVGSQVKTSDGTRIFAVIADTTNPAYDGSAGFNLPSGTATLTCTVQDVTTDGSGNLSIGTAGNVSAGTISLLTFSAAGVDTVTNSAPFTNGINAESDAALHSRFANYVQTRSKGTNPAIAYAISSVQQGLSWTIVENVNTASVYTPGSFVVTVDDGSGAPPSSLLASVSAAISTYRPIGSVWAVQAPTVTTATISLTIKCVPSTNEAAQLTPVQTAILAFVDGLVDGATLPYSRIAMVAYLVDPSIVDVTAVLLNGGTADLVPGTGGVIKATASTVTVSAA